MKLTANLKNWILEDGVYPGLKRGQLVNLSFELIGVEKITKLTEDNPLEFVHLGSAEYRFCGKILRIYNNDFLNEGGFFVVSDDEEELKNSEEFTTDNFNIDDYIQQWGAENPIKLVIIDINGFRFYIEYCQIQDCTVGDIVTGQGQLSLDHYAWVENLEKYQDPPDLFYTLKITEIKQVKIPENFITRDEDGVSCPTWLSSEKYTDDDMKSIENMFENHDDYVFYILDFDSEGVENETISRTFLGDD
jgi:hypothetical protein